MRLMQTHEGERLARAHYYHCEEELVRCDVGNPSWRERRAYS